MHRPSGFWALSLLIAAAGIHGCASADKAQPRPANGPFTGAWTVRWCEEGRTGQDCGGFFLYLVEERGRICGSHYGVDARQSRMDEGGMPSIVGTAQRDAAVVEIRSARNQSLIGARLEPIRGGMRWTMLATLEEGTNGEPALMPDRDVLTAADDAQARSVLAEVREACRQPLRR